MVGFIYLTKNKVTGKKYIGKRQVTWAKARVDSYLGSSKRLKADVEIYGKENFEREILEYFDSREALAEAEKSYIIKYDAVNSDDFYNLHEPNSKFVNLGPEDPAATKKRADKMRGKKRSKYTLTSPFRGLSQELEDQILKMHAQGATIWAIYSATKFHCSGIKKLLRSKNIIFKTNGWQQKWTAQEVKEIVDLYSAGMSCKAIAKQTGRNISTISSRLKEEKIELRDANHYKHATSN